MFLEQRVDVGVYGGGGGGTCAAVANELDSHCWKTWQPHTHTTRARAFPMEAAVPIPILPYGVPYGCTEPS